MTSFTGLGALADELFEQTETMLENNVTTVVEALVNARALDEACAELKKRFGALHKKYKEEIVPKKFEEEGVSSITIDGYRYTVSHQARTSIITSEKPAAYDWLRNNGLGDLITETVNSSTLSATAKTLAEDGIDLPDDLFKVHSFDNTSRTKK